MPEISFTVEGNPHGKARPRIARGGFVYTPKHTKEYERKVASEAQKAMRDTDAANTPVQMRILVYGGIPPSASNKRISQDYGNPWPGKPDADNVAKAICDGCNEIIYKDDCQIWSLEVVKLYDDKPRVEVTASWD